MSKYIKITPESVWTTPSADEFVPLLPSGCSFIDVLAAEIRRRGHASARFYAGYMGVDYLPFCNTLQTLTGSPAAQWIDRLVMLDNEWLLLNTLLKVNEIAKRRGYASGTDFSRAWKSRYRLSPEDYRRKNREVVTRVVQEIILSPH